MTNPDLAVWADVLSFLREHHPTICRQWFEEIEPMGTHEGAYRLRAHQQIHQRYLSKQCVEPFVEAFQSVTGHLIGVRFLGPEDVIEVPERASRGAVHVNGDLRRVPEHEGAESGQSIELKPRRSAWQAAVPRDLGKPEGLVIVPDNSFDQFVAGQETRFAFAAARAVADNPGKAYNPLFIHGGVGLGKTHLLQAICLHVLEQNEDANIFYTSCEAFTRQMHEAVHAGKIGEFSNYFRHLDMLLIDDVHFLTRLDRSQEEFFHTFNALHQAGKQIVLASDAPPNEIPDLEQRLVSRFQSGLVVPVNPPCFETRVQIVRQKARLRGMDFPDEVACYIAKRIHSNIRELGAMVMRIQMLHTTDRKPIDENLARLALEDTAPDLSREITIDDIIEVVCEHYGVKLSDLQSKRRQKSIALPRQVCMFLTRKQTRYSLEEVGGYFGGRDHTTVMHAVKTVDQKRKQDPEFDRILRALEQQLGIPGEDDASTSMRSPFARIAAAS